MLTAIVRQVSPAIASCELSYQERVAIDYALACRQHEHYIRALEDLGCQVMVLPAEPALPDSVFVEDCALVLDELAVITRPGVESRRPEVDSIAAALAPHRRLAHIAAPGTLEGGDILCTGHTIFVGLSGRSNSEGIAQLKAFAEPLGYTVQAVPLQGCLHLKSAVSQAATGAMLLNPHWVALEWFREYHIIAVDPTEPHAANALLVDGRAIYPSSFPRTLQRLQAHGIRTVLVDVSELQKAEGAVTCCSLLFNGHLAGLSLPSRGGR